eukprot:3799365-Heterocapsa_arctica.AAC.1
MARLSEPLSRRCEHRHDHGECRAVDAVRSGQYSDQLVDCVGRAITGGNNRVILPIMAGMIDDVVEAA